MYVTIKKFIIYCLLTAAIQGSRNNFALRYYAAKNLETIQDADLAEEATLGSMAPILKDKLVT